MDARLFLYLATHSLLYGFVHIDKAAGQIKCAFGGFFTSAHHEYLAAIVDNECCCCSANIGIIGEATVFAALALKIVSNKLLTATYWAVSKHIKRMFHITSCLCGMGTGAGLPHWPDCPIGSCGSSSVQPQAPSLQDLILRWLRSKGLVHQPMCGVR